MKWLITTKVSVPRRAKISAQWIQDRATGPVTKLKVLVPEKNYEDSEVAWPDLFVDPYVGKLYNQGRQGYELTEVSSVGFEYFANPSLMLKLYLEDPEHFLLILGYMNDV
jgi:hypothetical protein